MINRFWALTLFFLTVSLTVHAQENNKLVPKLPELRRTIPFPSLPNDVHAQILSAWSTNSFSSAAAQVVCPAHQEKPKSAYPSALSTIKTDGSFVLSFRNVTLSVDFKPSSVLVRIATQKDPDNRSGVLVPFLDKERWVYMAGKEKVDAALFIPPVTNCDYQFIVVCPRSLKPRNSLAFSALGTVGAIFDWSASSEGVLVSSTASPGTVRVSNRTTGNSPQPITWTDQETQSKASIVIKFDSRQRDQSEPAPALSESLPISAAVEGQAEYFINGELVHKESKATAFSVEEVMLPKQIKIVTTTAPAWLEAGTCLLINKFSK